MPFPSTPLNTFPCLCGDEAPHLSIHTYPCLCRDEAPEEKAVKEEIESLRKKLELVRASGPDPESIADEVASAAEDVEAKVQELAALKVELDEKVRGHSGG